MDSSHAVVAAGGVVWRDVADCREVLLVHRPRYDDWSLPKGKLNPSEHVLAGAWREIEEETGQHVRLGPPLGLQRYDVRRNGGTVPKLVHYWAASPVGEVGPFVPNDEVDELTWMPVGKARRQLSYPRDVDILDALDGSVPVASTVLLVRHTSAVKRKEWDGKDTLRQLTDEGARAADRLVDVLRALGVDRVLSSDAERCFATVAPYAAAAGLTIEEHPEISERGYGRDPSGLHSVADAAWSPGHVTVICSHRPVLPALSRELGLKVAKFAPGAFLVAHRLDSGRQLTERFSAP